MLDTFCPYEYMFAFIITPLNPAGKSFVGHIHFAYYNHFKETEHQILHGLLLELAIRNIPVFALSYDADATQTKVFTKKYWDDYGKAIVEKTYDFSFAKEMDNLHNEFGYYVCPDPLHILKRVRNRLVKGKCTLRISPGTI